jgi:molybdopterin-guanine dinucleotide biosynthesis protein A
MSVALTFSAVLLAAGRSTRMGVDKAVLRVTGLTLWERQLGVLRAAGCCEVTISARPEQLWVPANMPVVRDTRPDAGPLAGIAAALAQTEATHLMVLAVDLPRMDPAWWARLKSHCAPGVGAVGRHDGFYEPLAAIFPRELRGAAEIALSRDELSLQRFIAAAGVAMTAVEIAATEATWFTNWNAPDEAP